MLPLRCILVAPCLLLSLACEVPEALEAATASDAVAAVERPEGWESLEDPDAGSRLYYQFVDSRGSVRFVERMDEVPEQWRANVGFVKMPVPPPLSPGDAARTRRSTMSLAASRATPPGSEIILYSAEWCGACKKAKRYLARNDVAYDERDVDNPSIADELMRKTGRRSIPVLDVDGRVYTGFSPGAYDDLTQGA